MSSDLKGYVCGLYPTPEYKRVLSSPFHFFGRSEARGDPSHWHPGHEERLLGHSRRIHQYMVRDSSWSLYQEELYRLEQEGRVEEMLGILNSRTPLEQAVAAGILQDVVRSGVH